MESDLTRRQFGRLASTGLVSLTLPGRIQASTLQEGPVTELRYRSGDATPVSVAVVPRGSSDDDRADAVRAAALAATDFSWLSRGDSVLIKPACNSGNAYPATTDPVALRAVIGLLRDRGAGRVIVADMAGVQFIRFSKDHLRGSTRELMGKNRMGRISVDAGAELHAFEESGWDGFFEDTPAAKGSWTGSIMLPAILHEIDHVISMPRVSRHMLAGSTLALKSAVGWWRHDSRLEYHRDAATFSEKTADANSVPAIHDRQRLVLTSASKLQTTFGPDQGYVLEPDIGIVFASADPVAHDMVSLAWLIHGRTKTPAKHLDGVFDDPNRSGVVVNLANRIIVQWLGGFGEMLSTQHLARYDIPTIWDDRILRRAFEVFGGVPNIALTDAGSGLPEPLRHALQQSVALSG